MSEYIQIKRFLMERMPDPSRKRLVILTGARQTGKTTPVKEAYPDLHYVNLDAPENREAVQSIASASWARDVGVAILDEAQKEPAVFEKVKYAYDDGALPFSVLLGSSQILLLKRIRETLAGRVSLFELWPLMMSEIREAPSGRSPVAGRASGKPLSPPLVDRLFNEASIKDIFKDVPGILLDTPAGVVGMEIKARRVIAPKDVTALKEVARGLGGRWRGGLVIYLGDAIKPLADPEIWAVPSRRLFT